MKRREFIILSGIGATSASILSACGHPEEKLIPALIPDEEYVPGIDYWKPSTCGMCSAGCGIVVRTREHKANKIEGNPLHPINRGALCARGQAGLEVLYNPDRIKAPMKRIGERGEGKWQEISWDDAIQILGEQLGEIKSSGEASTIVFATSDTQGVLGIAIQSLRSALGTKFLVAQEDSGREVARGYSPGYGTSVPPVFDIANATYLLSFGARFLETWLSPVRYSLAYGEFRRSQGKTRGRFIQIEPRMSLTGANADAWIPAAVGSEGLIALAIAQVITREGLAKDPTAVKSLNQPLDSFKPEDIASATGIDSERIIRLAREFASAERPIAIGTGTGSSRYLAYANDSAIQLLNKLVGNVNKPGGVQVPGSARFNVLDRLPQFDHAEEIFGQGIRDLSVRLSNPNAVKIAALLLHKLDPLRIVPRSARWIQAIPFIASFSSFMDETTQLADLVMPDHTQLERWDLVSLVEPGSKGVVSLVQPVIAPLHRTMQTEDVLLNVSRTLGLKEPDPQAFQSAESMVKYAAQRLNSNGQKTEGEDDQLKNLTEAGVWVGDLPAKGSSPQQQPGLNVSALDVLRERTVSSSSLTLLCYEHAALGMGEFANLPSLQELPDPMTSVIWGSWVEINPQTAASLAVNDGDVVEIATDHGSVRAPAVLYPAIRPDVIAIPYGQGHTNHGRYANGRGGNVFDLNPFGAPGEAIAAKVTKVGGKAELIRFGTDLWSQMETKR